MDGTTLDERVREAAGSDAAPDGPVFEVGSRWRARINGCETYGAFAEILGPSGDVIGKGLIHRSKFFKLGQGPPRPWTPEEFLPPGAETDVEILAAPDAHRLELSTAGILAASAEPTPPRHQQAKKQQPEETGPSDPVETLRAGAALRHDLIRVMGRHTPSVAIRALRTAVAVLREIEPEERVSVYIEVRRT